MVWLCIPLLVHLVVKMIDKVPQCTWGISDEIHIPCKVAIAQGSETWCPSILVVQDVPKEGELNSSNKGSRGSRPVEA